mmetsp:Transcript_33008/g.87607  ORF Transcript_33008/g.87607 Transcript_33008/m.87607 type:complete len:333 (+) Transcript_33008:107-1105(+)
MAEGVGCRERCEVERGGNRPKGGSIPIHRRMPHHKVMPLQNKRAQAGKAGRTFGRLPGRGTSRGGCMSEVSLALQEWCLELILGKFTKDQSLHHHRNVTVAEHRNQDRSVLPVPAVLFGALLVVAREVLPLSVVDAGRLHVEEDVHREQGGHTACPPQQVAESGAAGEREGPHAPPLQNLAKIIRVAGKSPDANLAEGAGPAGLHPHSLLQVRHHLRRDAAGETRQQHAVPHPQGAALTKRTGIDMSITQTPWATQNTRNLANLSLTPSNLASPPRSRARQARKSSSQARDSTKRPVAATLRASPPHGHRGSLPAQAAHAATARKLTPPRTS